MTNTEVTIVPPLPKWRWLKVPSDPNTTFTYTLPLIPMKYVKGEEDTYRETEVVLRRRGHKPFRVPRPIKVVVM